MKKYFCDKCLTKINLDNLVIKNNKLVCPYCTHTLETDKFKVQQVKEKKDKEEVSYENRSTDN